MVAAQPWLLALLGQELTLAFVHALSGQWRQRASQAPELGGGVVPGVVRPPDWQRRGRRPEGQLQGGAPQQPCSCGSHRPVGQRSPPS